MSNDEFSSFEELLCLILAYREKNQNNFHPIQIYFIQGGFIQNTFMSSAYNKSDSRNG